KTTLGWGARGQFVEKVTNALSQETNQAWNTALGVPTSVTDPNGLVTLMDYDNFGRQTLERHSDLTYTVWDRQSCPSGCDARTRYRLSRCDRDTGASTYRTSMTDFNQFDRPFMTATQMPSGAYSIVLTDSDAKGRPSKRYVPFWSGAG